MQYASRVSACRREPNSHEAVSRKDCGAGRKGVAGSAIRKEETATDSGHPPFARSGYVKKSCRALENHVSRTSAGGAQRRKTRHHPGSSKRLRAPEAEVFSQLVGPPGRAMARLLAASEGGGFKTRTATVLCAEREDPAALHQEKQGAMAGLPPRLTQQYAALPNPSVNRTHYGRPAWPGRRYAVHFRQPGQAVLP